MADRPPRKGRQTTRMVVRQADRITPHLIRIVAAPAEPEDFPRFETPYTDAYLKVVFPLAGVTYPEPFDMAAAREALPREQWPVLRTYTLREVRPETGDLVLDFVYHGDVGLAGPWAATAAPGTEFHVAGPGGAYAPDPTADWHLLVGDESALPAIAASLRQIPAGVPAHVFAEVGGAEDELPLETPGELRLRWLHRPDGVSLLEAVRTAFNSDFPTGRVHAFVHGEASAIKELRRYLVYERGVPLGDLSISGYWKQGVDDEGYRATKQDARAAEAVEDARHGLVEAS